MDAHPTGTAAVSWANGRIDTFWVETDRSLIHRAFAAWFVARAGVAGRDAGFEIRPLSPWAEDQMEVFALFPDGELWDRYWDGMSWHAWESLGGELTGQPAALVVGSRSTRCLRAGPRWSGLWHRWWDGSAWVDWERLPR